MKKSALLIAGMAVLALGGWGALHVAPVEAPEVKGHAILDVDGNVVGRYIVPADRDILAQPNADQILTASGFWPKPPGYCPTMWARR